MGPTDPKGGLDKNENRCISYPVKNYIKFDEILKLSFTILSK